MSSVEQELSYLEYETRALKASFERQAASIPVFNAEATIATIANLCHYRYYVPEYGEYLDYEVYDYERVQVTFNTASGIDTIATLEVDGDAERPPKIRRINYRGGARWIVSNMAKVDYSTGSSGQWKPTNYKFAIHSMADGIVEVENMTS